MAFDLSSTYSIIFGTIVENQSDVSKKFLDDIVMVESADERASVWSSWSPSGSWLHCNNPEPAERQNHRDEDANMSHTNWHSSVSLMAYLHWWTRIRIPIPMATLYYA